MLVFSIAERCSYSRPTQRFPTQSHPSTYSSEALEPIYMKDRKSFKNSDNAMEQESSFQKGLFQKRQRLRRRQIQRQRMKKTQHVLYFRKAEEARISNITFSPNVEC